MMTSNKLLGAIKRNERMFCKGEAYRCLEDFIADWRSLESSRYTYWNHKLMHVNFVAGMRLSSLSDAIDRGVLSRAVKRSNDDQ